MNRVTGGKYKLPVTVKKIKNELMTVIEVEGNTYNLVHPDSKRGQEIKKKRS